MTTIPLLALALVIAAPAAAAPAKEGPVASAWAHTPVQVDGSARDWAGRPTIPYKDAGMEYAVSNDGANLYALVVFKDRNGMSTLELTGLTVYFNAAGKKSKDLGIRFFRKRVPADELIAEMEKSGQVLSDQRKAEIRTRPAYPVFAAEVVNKKKLAAPVDPAFRSLPPGWRSAVEDNALVYEVRIPLSRTNQPGGVGADPGAAIKLGFEWGGATDETRQAMLAQRAEAESRAQQGAAEMRVRDTSGEGEGGDFGEVAYQRGPKKYTVWTDVVLAKR